jgi:hypothetical protein
VVGGGEAGPVGLAGGVGVGEEGAAEGADLGVLKGDARTDDGAVD